MPEPDTTPALQRILALLERDVTAVPRRETLRGRDVLRRGVRVARMSDLPLLVWSDVV